MKWAESSKARPRAGAAIVFGGASGLGQGAARRLAACYETVVVADRAREAAEVTARTFGGIPVLCDITNEASVRDAISVAADSTRAGVRIAVNCAGIAPPGKLVSQGVPTALDHFETKISVNLLGTICTLRLAAEAMSLNELDQRGERGVFIATASIAAFEGQIGQAAYAASKGGVASLTLPAARELASSAIRVMAIAPGLFATPLLARLPEKARANLAGASPFPKRFGDPDEFAALVVHIAENSMLNGEVIRLDGAIRMGPR